VRLLVVTAVEAERLVVARELAGDGVEVLAAGVGMAAAAASTARALATAPQPYDLVLSAGIAGGFTDVGATVLAARSIAADLGADSPDGFLPLDELGFGSSTVGIDVGALAWLRGVLPDAKVGDVLTVSTVTGTAERAAALLARHPEAVAEAMEGFGVATAAGLAGVPFAELRTISNPVGPRDRGAWRIREALDALGAAAARLAVSRPATGELAAGPVGADPIGTGPVAAAPLADSLES
jgi:futalosine hydrolase